jgi:hypothetical protein
VNGLLLDISMFFSFTIFINLTFLFYIVILPTISFYESHFTMNLHDFSLRAVFSFVGSGINDQAIDIVKTANEQPKNTFTISYISANHILRPIKGICAIKNDGNFYIGCTKTFSMNPQHLDSNDFFDRIELASKLDMNAIAYENSSTTINADNSGSIDFFGPFTFSQAVGFIETLLLLNIAEEAKAGAEKVFKQTAPDSMLPK